MTEWLETTDDDPRDVEIERLRERLADAQDTVARYGRRLCRAEEVVSRAQELSVCESGEPIPWKSPCRLHVARLETALRAHAETDDPRDTLRERLAEVERERDEARAECDRLRRMLDTALEQRGLR